MKEREREREVVAERNDFCSCEATLELILELQFVTYIRIFPGHCHMKFPYNEILFFFGHCHVTFSYMELLSFFVRFVPKLEVFFTESLDEETTQQSDGSCNVRNSSQLLYKLNKKQSFYICKHLRKIPCEKRTM